MTIACIINDYYDSPLTNNAIKSVLGLVDSIIVVNSVKPYDKINDDSIIYLNLKESDVGKRYIYGLNTIIADYYFLLDYDDTFEINKINYAIKELTKWSVLKENDKYDNKMTLIDNVIINHIDWHISKYSFNDYFKNYLINFIEVNKVDTSASFDKILFSVMLAFGFYKITKEKLTNKINHNDSKMHLISKKLFYSKTFDIFTNLANNNAYYNTMFINYVWYNIFLNKFLCNRSKESYKVLINEFEIPLRKKLYYKSIIKR